MIQIVLGFWEFLICMGRSLFYRPDCVPVYDPVWWHAVYDRNGYNNCYNYACDILTGTRAQPGQAHGFNWEQLAQQGSPFTCENLISGAIADGLAPVDCDTCYPCIGCSHLVMLFVTPDHGNYHWYRRDRDGTWSHKMGWGSGTDPSNKDEQGNIITDPRTADRSDLTEFCGCFCVDKSRVTIA